MSFTIKFSSRPWKRYERIQAGTIAETLAEGNDVRLTRGQQTIFEADPGLGYSTGKLAIADTAYWVYMGIAPYAITIAYIRTTLTVNGGGAQTMEVAVASSATAPTGSALTLTKIAATGSFDDLTTGAAKRVKNSSALGALVPAGTPWWTGIRTNFATTQPTFTALIRDDGLGRLCSTASAGALTSGSSWTATPIAFVADATVQAPRLTATTF